MINQSKAVKILNVTSLFELPKNLSDIQKLKVLGLFDTWSIQIALTRDLDEYLWDIGLWWE